ncbi:MAG: hypothetical protein QXT86_12265 [Archaeoglobaceae archaeon]
MKFVYVKDIRRALTSLKEHLKAGNWDRNYYYGLVEHDGWVLPYWDTTLLDAGFGFIHFLKPEDDEKALKCFLRASLDDLVKEAVARFISMGYGIEIHTRDRLASWFKQYILKKGIDLENWINERELTGKDMVEMLKPIERRIESYIKKYSKLENEVRAGDFALMKKTGHCGGSLVYDVYFFDRERGKTLKRMVEEFTVRAEVDPFYCEHCGMPHSLAIGRWIVYEVSAGVLEQAQELETSLTELLKSIHSC